jgi:membrane-bound lytic murein transglycosylase B
MAAVGVGVGLLSSAALADCGNDAAGFAGWLERLKARAAKQGISAATVESALSDVTYDRRVIGLDRSQRSFKLSFEEFYARRVGAALIRRGQAVMQRHRATLDRVEQRFGVPPPVLIAIWGLETNYGADTSGRFSILARSPPSPTTAGAPHSSRRISSMPCASSSGAT